MNKLSVELGCGNGNIITDEKNVIGVDIDRKKLLGLAENKEYYGLVQADAFQLPFRQKSLYGIIIPCLTCLYPKGKDKVKVIETEKVLQSLKYWQKFPDSHMVIGLSHKHNAAKELCKQTEGYIKWGFTYKGLVLFIMLRRTLYVMAKTRFSHMNLNGWQRLAG